MFWVGPICSKWEFFQSYLCVCWMRLKDESFGDISTANFFFQVTLGSVRPCCRMATSALWGRWPGHLVVIIWPLPVLMLPHASGKKRTTTLRLDDTFFAQPVNFQKKTFWTCHLELDRVGRTRKRGQMRGVGSFREPPGYLQPRQERLGLGRFVVTESKVKSSVVNH